jgi:hypothetical protein
MTAPKLPLPEDDDPLGFLRWLGLEISQALIDMSDADATPPQLEDACDRLHYFATELCLLTVDVRKWRN